MKNFDTEFQYNEKNFRFIQMKVRQLAGINLPDTKTALVYSRISRLLRQHHFNSFDQYCEYLNQHNSQIENEFVNAITTNFTSFMREKHHFEYLHNVILPELIKRNSHTKKLRVWSAGCSTGEEAYSLSFVIKDVLGDMGWDIKILATDVDSDVINKAKQGVYTTDDIKHLPHNYLYKQHEYFTCDDNGKHEVKNDLKNMIYFKLFNLMSKDEWPMSGPFDVIFCRNVMIYFERNAQHHVIHSFINKLAINGYLFLGHSESVPGNMLSQLRYVDKTIYRRVQ